MVAVSHRLPPCSFRLLLLLPPLLLLLLLLLLVRFFGRRGAGRRSAGLELHPRLDELDGGQTRWPTLAQRVRSP